MTTANNRLDYGNSEAAGKDRVVPFTMLELDFPDGIGRVTSLPFDVRFEDKTYYGLSVLGTVSEVTEGPENRSYGVVLTLTGVPVSFTEYLLNQRIQGRTATLKVGFLNDFQEFVSTPYTTFVGRMDTMDVKVGRETAVQISCESLLVDWERPRIRRFTDADQRAAYPTDRGLEYVAAQVNKNLLWGKS
jgi:hypothetical protein